jgi:hypothetical protein
MATLSPTLAHRVTDFFRRTWGLAGLVALAAASLGSQDFATAQQTPDGDPGIVEPAAAAAPAPSAHRVTFKMPASGYTVLGPGATLPLTKGV